MKNNFCQVLPGKTMGNSSTIVPPFPRSPVAGPRAPFHHQLPGRRGPPEPATTAQATRRRLEEDGDFSWETFSW